MATRSVKALICSLLLAPWAYGAELQTDWIEPVQGQGDKTLGVEVKAVESSAEGDETKVTMTIPKASLEGDIEEVVVTGKRPDKSEVRLNIRHEWLADYDRDNYGLVLYLGKDGNIPLRLYLKAE